MNKKTNVFLSSSLPFSRCCRSGFCFKFHLISVGGNRDGLSRRNLATQELDGQRILYERLNRALQRPRTVLRVVTFTREKLTRRFVQHKRDVALPKHLSQALQLHINNLHDLLARELMKDDYVV